MADLQNLVANLLCDVFTQTLHKRAHILKAGDREVSYDDLMSKHMLVSCLSQLVRILPLKMTYMIIACFSIVLAQCSAKHVPFERSMV